MIDISCRSYDEVAAALERSRILWGPYRSIEELVRDPESIMHVGDLMEDVEHPGIGIFPTPRATITSGRRDQKAIAAA